MRWGSGGAFRAPPPGCSDLCDWFLWRVVSTWSTSESPAAAEIATELDEAVVVQLGPPPSGPPCECDC